MTENPRFLTDSPEPTGRTESILGNSRRNTRQDWIVN